MRNPKPQWLAQKLRLLGRTGRLDLSGEILDDLSILGSRAALKHLDLSFTRMQTLAGLPLQPRLESIVLDSSDLQNFKNFRAIQAVASISLKNTPVSHLPNFKLSLLLVLGSSLRVINGQQVNAQLRQKAAAYPAIAADLVNCGWVAESPSHLEANMEALCRRFGLGEAIGAEEEEEEDAPPAQPDESLTDEPAPREPESRLAGKIEALLTAYGFEVDATDKIASIVGIVESLLTEPSTDDELAVPEGLGGVGSDEEDDEEQAKSD
jgi:hypothetical protein